MDMEYINSVIKPQLTNFYRCDDIGEVISLDVLNEITRPYSNITFLGAKFLNNYKKLVMKTVVHNPLNLAVTLRENQAIVEFEILKYLYPKYSEIKNCVVPRPLFVLPEKETYIMEFVSGSSLIDEFRYTRYFSSYEEFKKLTNYLYLCGKWLKHFQNITGFEKADMSALSDVMERAESRLKLIEDYGSRLLPQGFREKVLSFLNSQLQLLIKQELYICGRHGDFSPINMIVDQEKFTVIDFLGYKKDSAFVDIFKVIVFLEDEINSITTSRSRVVRLKKAFFEGYGDIPYGTTTEKLICETMQRIVSLFGHISNKQHKFHHKMNTLRCAKEHIKWIMARVNGFSYNTSSIGY